MFDYEDPTSLSQLYHLNSEPWQNNEAYESAGYEVEYKEIKEGADEIELGAPPTDPLLNTIRQRSSCRQFQSQFLLPRDVFSLLLTGMYGIIRTDYSLLNGFPLWLRAVPSAGGLYPLEINVLTQRVSGISDGLHHYNVRRHSLEPLDPRATFAQFEPLLFNFPFIENANALFLISAVFRRTQKKYGPRGYRYVLLEAGHAAQNLCLLAAEQGLGSLCMGGYPDARLNAALKLETPEEGIVYSVAVGLPA